MQVASGEPARPVTRGPQHAPWSRQHRLPVRAVIYARYSSDLQSEASIEDQVEVCQREISRRGWTFVQVYEDRAMSGSS